MLLLIDLVIRFAQACVFFTVVLGWMGVDPNHPAFRRMRAVGEPILAFVRPLAKKIPGPFDFAPAIALMGLEILRRLLGG